MEKLTIKEKIYRVLGTGFIWAIIFALVEWIDPNPFTAKDAMYYFGTYIGYCICMFSQKILK